MFMILFNDNGFYSRSEKIIDQLKALHERKPDDEHLAYRYIASLMSRSFDIWTYHSDTLETYFEPIDEIIKKYEFPPEWKNDIEFKRNKMLCDYSSICKLSEGMKYHKKLIEITTETKSLFYIDEC